MSNTTLYAALDVEGVAWADARRAQYLRRRVERRLRARLGVPSVIAALDRLVAIQEAAARRHRMAVVLVAVLDDRAAEAMPPLAEIGRIIEIDCGDCRL